jgi:hypothetical protein
MKGGCKQAALSALLFVAVSPCAAHGSAQAPTPVIVGGYRAVATSDPDVRAAAQFAVRSLEGSRGRLRSIEAAQQQVVAGVNHRLDLTTASGRRWRVTVYRPLRGRLQLTNRERLTRP